MSETHDCYQLLKPVCWSWPTRVGSRVAVWSGPIQLLEYHMVQALCRFESAALVAPLTHGTRRLWSVVPTCQWCAETEFPAGIDLVQTVAPDWVTDGSGLDYNTCGHRIASTTLTNPQGSCFPRDFGGSCSGTPRQCQDCNQAINC